METDNLGGSGVADPLYCPHGVQWVIKEEGMPILEDGQMVRRHSNEGKSLRR